METTKKTTEPKATKEPKTTKEPKAVKASKEKNVETKKENVETVEVKETKAPKATKKTKVKETKEVNEVKEEVVMAESNTNETQIKKPKRSFKSIYMNYNGEIIEEGRYKARKPKQAASKALTAIYKKFSYIKEFETKQKNQKTMTKHKRKIFEQYTEFMKTNPNFKIETMKTIKFGVVETTRGSKHKKYWYAGERNLLEGDTDVKTVIITKKDKTKSEIKYRHKNSLNKINVNECLNLANHNVTVSDEDVEEQIEKKKTTKKVKKAKKSKGTTKAKKAKKSKVAKVAKVTEATVIENAVETTNVTENKPVKKSRKAKTEETTNVIEIKAEVVEVPKVKQTKKTKVEKVSTPVVEVPVVNETNEKPKRKTNKKTTTV
jgi:hypothetical protein